MGERSDQITREIEHSRAELGSNLQELEHKVKDLTDWRLQFQKNPLTVLGLAFGGGILLASAMPNHRSSRYARERRGSFAAPGAAGADESERATNSQLRRASNTWDTIKGALIGVAAGKAQSFLQDAIPGFGEEFQKVRRREHPELNAQEAPSNRTVRPAF